MTARISILLDGVWTAPEGGEVTLFAGRWRRVVWSASSSGAVSGARVWFDGRLVVDRHHAPVHITSDGYWADPDEFRTRSSRVLRRLLGIAAMPRWVDLSDTISYGWSS